jgi:hypothetical protein
MTSMIAVTVNGWAPGLEAREFRALICSYELSSRPPDPGRRVVAVTQWQAGQQPSPRACAPPDGSSRRMLMTTLNRGGADMPNETFDPVAVEAQMVQAGLLPAWSSRSP